MVKSAAHWHYWDCCWDPQPARDTMPHRMLIFNLRMLHPFQTELSEHVETEEGDGRYVTVALHTADLANDSGGLKTWRYKKPILQMRKLTFGRVKRLSYCYITINIGTLLPYQAPSQWLGLGESLCSFAAPRQWTGTIKQFPVHSSRYSPMRCVGTRSSARSPCVKCQSSLRSSRTQATGYKNAC